MLRLTDKFYIIFIFIFNLKLHISQIVNYNVQIFLNFINYEHISMIYYTLIDHAKGKVTNRLKKLIIGKPLHLNLIFN